MNHRHRWKIAAVIAGVMIAAVLAVPLFVNVNTFRPMLEAQLTTALGRQVKLGKLSLSVLSGSVVARDLSIADDPQFSSAPFLTATTLRLGVEMRPLIFQRRLLVRSLEVDAPKIHLVHAPKDIWNFSTIGQSAAARSPSPQQSSILPGLTVQRFSIKDGHATVESLPAQGAPLIYSQVALTVQDFSFTKQFPFTLKANLPGEGTLSVTGKAGPIDPHNAARTTFEAQVTFRHFDPVAAGLLDKSAGISVLADIDAHAASNGETINSNGTVHAQHLKLRPDAVPAPGQIDVTYSVAHTLRDNTGQLQDAAAQTGKLTAHLSGGYSLEPGTALLNMKLAGQNLPIDELQALLPAAGVNLPHGSALRGGTLTTSLSITGPLQALLISGPVELSNTRLAGFNISSQLKGLAAAALGQSGDVTNIQTLRLNLQITPNGTRADNIYASLPAIGEAVGSGTVSPAQALNFHLNLKLDTSRGIGGKAVDLLSMLNRTTGQTAAQAAAKGVPVTITGTSANPILTADMKGLLNKNATSILGKPKGSGQQVIDVLGGLFGGSKKQ
jgi:AsmA protein